MKPTDNPTMLAIWRAACDNYNRAEQLDKVAGDLEEIGDSLMEEFTRMACDCVPDSGTLLPDPGIEPPCNPRACRAPNGETWDAVVTAYEEQVDKLAKDNAELRAQLTMARWPATGRTDQ